MQILIPKRLPHLPDTRHLPLFFIGGPIRGGGDWQTRMCRELHHAMGGRDFIAAVPCRWPAKTHPLQAHFMKAPEYCERQTLWERVLLAEAGEEDRTESGCIIFYLGKQAEPRPPEMGMYGRDTLGEIGEWRGRMMHNPRIRLVIGADPEFDPDGISVMEANFSHALRYNFSVYRGIEATAQAAIRRSLLLNSRVPA